MLKSVLRRISMVPYLGAVLRLPYRFKVAMSYYWPRLGQVLRWLFTSREITNFTYQLTDISIAQMTATIAHVTGKPFSEIQSYIDELHADEQLRTHVIAMATRSKEALVADKTAYYGRRAGWYAIVRAAKPSVVVETGVDKGLGSCVLCAALARNSADGRPGRYYGTDINPAAGQMLAGDYAKFGEILYGDSIETLQGLDETIDIFVNDSDHSADYEAREYQTVRDKLSDQAILLGDNAHCTSKLLEFAIASGRDFLFIAEVPKQHWYPGAGIGIAFRAGKN